MPIFIGIDPGSRITGYGVIQSEGMEHRYITCGSLKLPTTSIDERLRVIFNSIHAIMSEFKPNEAAIEQVFMHQNPGAALKLGQARGAAIVAIAHHNISVAEYSARQIKQSVVGYGAAAKDQVQHMIRCLLNLKKTPEPDAADALAVAICHAQTKRGIHHLVGVKGSMRRGRLR
ncbi:MAG: crossover junction endodeoxyribonuclease RuvC [Proteobacteria bacterium]|nr:crossover junction endodeoxyribonuclease RuvC [Pseudomonadota bacterium]